MPAGADSLTRLRQDLEQLLERSDVGSRRDFGQKLGWKTGEEMIRLFLDGQTEISLGKAAEWAKECGAELRAVPLDDKWAALDVAIGGLPDDHHDLKRHLRALVRSDQVTPQRARGRPRDRTQAV